MTAPHRPHLRLALLLAALSCASQATAALRLAPEALPPEAAAATRQLFDETLRRLPPALAEWDVEIAVRWRGDLPAHVHGRARGRAVRLDRALLDGWMARPAAADGRVDPGDPAVHAALSALVHEIAHVHDTLHARMSSDPRLLDLAGWQVQPLRFGLRSPVNAFDGRSPDRYELRSPAEFVAVNLEHFLLDAEYACRRPALHAYFAGRFDWAPPATACAPGLAYVEAAVVADADTPPLLELDPARVYAVDYLLAEGNDVAMSRWGHSMLRLVVCAPGRPPGPDCRLDLQHHRVLSFRAFVDDVQISNWRGLTGSYPSRLFLLSLDQVVEEYTKVELRGLASVPLRLSPEEVRDLLERAATVHWSYDGRYRFLGNNCAVETFKLLHDGVPRLAREPLSSITPTGLLKRLRRTGVASDEEVPADHAEAVRLGYRFDPWSAHYQAMFDIAREAQRLPQSRVEDWLALPPARRAPALAQAGLRDGAALLLLEGAALRRQEALARDELKRRYFGRGVASADPAGALVPALQAVMREGALLARPASLLPGGGYGLPQAEERERALREGGERAARLREHDATLRREARHLLTPGLRESLEGAEANFAAIGDRLRALHQVQGGFQLR